MPTHASCHAFAGQQRDMSRAFWAVSCTTGSPHTLLRYLVSVDFEQEYAIRFHNKIAYDDEYNGLALDDDEGHRIASKLGNKKVIFLANHGVVVVGPNVAEAFDDLYYLERAAMLQVLAQSTGRPYQKISSKVVDLTVEQMIGEAETAILHFAALKRILDKEEPDYVN